MDIPKGNPLYNEVIIDGKLYEKGNWQHMPEIYESDTEIKGFFGENRFLSNFCKAIITMDGVSYSSVENAYQAAKWHPNDRQYFVECSSSEAKKYNNLHCPNLYTAEQWDAIKLIVMDYLVEQKFDPYLNPELCQKLLDTGDKYLEETNWWNDIFWGKTLDGEGENNLGIMEMRIRDQRRANLRDVI